MSEKRPYRGVLKADRTSIFKLDPILARWILRRPNSESLKNLFGHAVNEDYNGVLFRDEDEARAARRRQDINMWELEEFIAPKAKKQLNPYTISQTELDAKDEKGNLVIPLHEWPYLVMLRKAQAFQSTPQEVPVSPTRRELFHFIRDKSVAAATVSRDLGSVQAQLIELQKTMKALTEAKFAPGEAVPNLAPTPSPTSAPASVDAPIV